MKEVVTHYFEVGGMTCTSCSATIKSVLLSEKFVREADINLVTAGARVVVEKGTDPQAIIKAIEDVGFTARWISPRKEKTIYFALTGLKYSRDANLIAENLNQNKGTIKSAKVNYSTSTAIVKAHVDDTPKKMKVLIRHIKNVIKKSISERKISAKVIEPPILEDRHFSDPKQFFRKALINGIAALPLIFASSFIPLPLSIFGQLIGLGIGGITFGLMWYTGKEFYQDAWRGFKRRASNMNTLIALGTGSAWVYSMLLVLAPTLFPIAALEYQFLAVNMILGIINLGKGVRAHAQERMKDKVQSLAKVFVSLQPQMARRCEQKSVHDKFSGKKTFKIKQIHYLDIKEGDILQVKVHERFPVEGIILNQIKTFVNQKTLTGETSARIKKKGDEVFSGSLNTTKTAYIRATRKGSQGHLTRVIEDIAKSSASKTSISKLIDKLAVVFAPTIVGLSLLTAAGWLFIGSVSALPFAIQSSIAVLICACPCTMLFSPMAAVLGTYSAFNKGIFVHDNMALESAANVDTVVFDKTGTLTTPVVDKVYTKSVDWTERTILHYVASLEKVFDHPIAKALVCENSAARLYPVNHPKKEEQGVVGEVNGDSVLVGSLAHLESKGIKISKSYKMREHQYARSGMTSVYVAINGQCVAVISLKHDIRDDAKKAIKDLERLNMDIYMLTGDNSAAAKAVAHKLGIKKVYAEHNSKMKMRFIRSLKKKGLHPAVVGDGFNDTEAISEAEVGIAQGPWTNASATAHIAVQKLNIAQTIIIAKETMRTIHQNLSWALIYNIVSVSAAMGLFMGPVFASGAMGLSSLIVVLNSIRLAYKIDHAVDMFDGKISPPHTLWEKIQNFLSLRSMYRALEMFLSFNSAHRGESAEDASHEQGHKRTRHRAKQSKSSAFIMPKTPSLLFQKQSKRTRTKSRTNLKRSGSKVVRVGKLPRNPSLALSG